MKVRQDKHDWIAAAKNVPTMVAQATALDQLVDYLFNQELACTNNGCIEIDKRLAAICTIPNLITFGGIAKFFLIHDPPNWVPFSYSNDSFQLELLPTEVENGLSWLAEIREGVIFEAWQIHHQDDSFKKWLGDLGESLVMSGEKANSRNPLQVSVISDSYGYDILSKNGSEAWQLEVKTVVESSSHHFYLSRNEFEKAQKSAKSWSIYQVVFSNDIFDTDLITMEMVKLTRSLPADIVIDLVPRDVPTGQWLDSAKITVPDELWQKVNYPIFNWQARGYKK